MYIVAIRYNILNLPDTVQFANGNQIINYYDALGTRYKTSYRTRKVAATVPVPLSTTLTATDNLSDYTMITHAMDKNIKYLAYGNDALTLDYVFNSEGYIRYYNAWEHYRFYYIKDHLGNVRETYMNPAQGSKLCAQRMQYYPSGLPWNDNLYASEQPYKYNGKEFVEMHGYDTYDYGFRGYYPALGRFTSVDPLAEKYHSATPYAYCLNNPINAIDPNGMDVWKVDSTGTIVDTTPSDETDRVEVETVNEESNTAETISIDFEKGTITIVDNNKNRTVFQANGEIAAADLFKFLADNIKIEFGLITTYEGVSAVTTNHQKKKVLVTQYAYKYAKQGYNLKHIIHNHPTNSDPSGFNQEEIDGDRESAQYFPTADRYVYRPSDELLVFYDSMGYVAPTFWMAVFPSTIGKINTY